jgi:hypothetical protein
MTCINKNLKEFKDISKVYGDELAETMVRSYPKNYNNKDIEEFYIPTKKELNNWLNNTRENSKNFFIEAIGINPYMTKEAIISSLKGVIRKKDDSVFIITGWVNAGSLFQKSEALKTVFNLNLKVIKDLALIYPKLFKIVDTRIDYIKKVEITPTEKPKPTQGTLFQNTSPEGQIASEKTIRELAARMSDRIGMPIRFESDRTKQYKGKIENGVAYINLAYATLDTPIHEILGHPIVRAIKNTERKDGTWGEGKVSELYNNLLKELETGRGKEVLDRVKRDYVNKNQYNKEDFSIQEEEQFDINEKKRIKRFTILNSKNPYNAQNIYKNIEDAQKELERLSSIQPYTLEEQQEEAIVELLGMITAEKLDNVKDGKLISLLKRLLKEMKAFIRQLLNQKEVEIDKLPDNMTLGDLSDLLAYSNSKLILPGYEVEYTTPDNMKFKTYSEASNHIGQLAKSVEDVDLDKSISVDNIDKEIETLQKELDNFKFEIEPFNKFTDVYTKKGRLRQNYWARKKDGTTGWTGGSKETLIEPEYDGFVLDIDRGDGRFITKISDKEAEELYYAEENKFNTTTKASREKYAELETKIHNLKNNSLKGFIEKNKEYEQSKEIIEEWKKVNNIQYNPEEIYSRGQEFSSVVGAYSSFDVNLMMQNLLSHIEDNEKAGGKFAISAYTKPVDKTIGHLEGGGGKIKFNLYPQSEDILWASNTDVYSGSVWDASEKVNKDKKSELLGVSYTKYPSLQSVGTIQPNLASIVDNLAHHHNELGIALTGNNFRLEYDEDIPYQTKKIIDGINKILDQKYGRLVKPEIKQKQKIKDLEEILAYYNGNIIESPQKVIINGKEIKSFVFDISLGKKFKSVEEAEEFRKSHILELKSRISNDLNIEIPFNAKKDFFENLIGIQPTQTKDTLKESIESVKSKLGIYSSDEYPSAAKKVVYPDSVEEENDFIEQGYFKTGRFSDEGYPEYILQDVKPKEYTSQALINTKIAKLKEVAKKYPRSLIRSEVKPTNSQFYKNLGFEEGEMPFQKVPEESSIKQGIQELFDSNESLTNANKAAELKQSSGSIKNLNELNTQLENYLKQFGFNTEQLEDLKEITGYSIIGATDFLEKTIFVQKENIDKAYTKEAAYSIFNLLGRKNLLRKDLIASIHLIDNYDSLKSKYINSKLSDYKIRELIAIDYLQNKLIEAHKEALPTTNKAVSKDATAKNKLEYAVLRIKQWWSNIIRNYFKSYKKGYIEDVFNQIANDVINNNTKLFNLSKEISYKKIELTGKQKEINDNLVKLGAINSGSYSLNRQGNLTRENINDLDYFLPYQIKDEFIKNVVKKYPQALFTEPYSGVMGNRSLTLSLKIDDVKIDFFLPTSQEESDKNKIIVIDNVKYHHWKDIFDAKIRIGSKKHLSDLAGFVPFQKEMFYYKQLPFSTKDNNSDFYDEKIKDLENKLNLLQEERSNFELKYPAELIKFIHNNVFQGEKYADKEDKLSKEYTSAYYTNREQIENIKNLKFEIENNKKKYEIEVNKPLKTTLENNKSLDIIGQRHYNFDFIQSKYNKQEYNSTEQVIQSDNIKSYWDKNLEQTALNYFKDNNIDFEKSTQYQDLLSYFNNKNKAIIAYYLTFSENFKKFYGNINSRKGLPSFIINSTGGNYSKLSILLEEEGEPVIFYHGAGTTFDKFSKDYFLSGEGAMAYGAGFYATNYKPTADQYRDTAKAAIKTFRKLLEEKNEELLKLMSSIKGDIDESKIISFMTSHGLDDNSTFNNAKKIALLNLLGLTETKALYIALTNPLYWQKDISKKNKNLIESHFNVKLKSNHSGQIYTELEKTLKISDKELSSRLYQIGIDGVVNIARGGQAVGGFSHKKGETHVIFFEPVQAKSVNNSGLFSLTNENMYDPIEIKEDYKPNKETVESYRAQEQEELSQRIPNIENYKVDGKVVKSLITDENDLKIYNEIYDKYDALITPLLEASEETKEQPEDILKTYEEDLEQDTEDTEDTSNINEDDDFLEEDFPVEEKENKPNVEYTFNEEFELLNRKLISLGLNTLSLEDYDNFTNIQKEIIKSCYGI